MTLRTAGGLTAAVCLLAACASDPEARSDSTALVAANAVRVPAAAETQAVGTAGRDAADDPEIWADPRDPSRAVIIGTDKQAGLYVYGLDGQVRQFLPDGMLNNVDLRGGFATPAGERVLVAASDRKRIGAALYLLDPATMRLEPWGLAPVALTEPYGLCLGRRGADVFVIVDGTDGQVRQLRLSAGPDGAPVSTEVRRFGLATQTEGCVVDDARGVLYIGEEDRGIWRFPLNPTDASPGVLIAEAGTDRLKADVEGLTLMREGARTWLIASSQGDSAFALWRVDGDAPAYVGRFVVAAAKGIDGVTGTDGVAAHAGPVGRYPAGVVVMQDDVDTTGETAGASGRQNFKVVDWAEVKRALGID